MLPPFLVKKIGFLLAKKQALFQKTSHSAVDLAHTIIISLGKMDDPNYNKQKTFLSHSEAAFKIMLFCWRTDRTTKINMENDNKRALASGNVYFP